MNRFRGNHQGTRQVRGFRHVKLATREERLASMHRELNRRVAVFGDHDPLVERQKQTIAREEVNDD